MVEPNEDISKVEIVQNTELNHDKEKLGIRRKSQREWYYRDREQVLEKICREHREQCTDIFYQLCRKHFPKPTDTVEFNRELLEYVSNPLLKLADVNVDTTIYRLHQISREAETDKYRYNKYVKDIAELSLNLYLSAKIIEANLPPSCNEDSMEPNNV